MRNKDRAADQTILSASIPQLVKDKLTETARKDGKSVSKWLTENLEGLITGDIASEGLSNDIKRELAALSLNLGLSVPALTEIAVKGLLNYVEAHDGMLPLPLDFTRAWTELREVLDETESN